MRRSRTIGCYRHVVGFFPVHHLERSGNMVALSLSSPDPRQFWTRLQLVPAVKTGACGDKHLGQVMAVHNHKFQLQRDFHFPATSNSIKTPEPP